MAIAQGFIKLVERVLPAPFTLSVLLTLVTMGLALVLTGSGEQGPVPYWLQVGTFWEKGFWDLLSFAMQMMLMLVLGHVLALTPPVTRIIDWVVRYCENHVRAVVLVAFLSILVGLVNWGLGLIFGAILARKVGEAAAIHGRSIHYPMVGAAGYAGLMVWHGGLSGSAPIKVAESGHFLMAAMGQVPMSQTIFSPMNLIISVCVLLLVPLAMGLLARKVGSSSPADLKMLVSGRQELVERLESGGGMGAERLDQSRWLSVGFGLLILLMAFYRAVLEPSEFSLAFLTPNFVNFALLGLALVSYANLSRFMESVETAIQGAAGIMIQYPLYAGIAGVMKYSGLVALFSTWLVNASNVVTFPVFTLVSAGLVNIFVPSGGGQWAVQGPIIVAAAPGLEIPFGKCVMAVAYGDQLTNMLQPFWALPLLAITRLRAQEILPYTAFMMLVGGAIYTIGLLVF